MKSRIWPRKNRKWLILLLGVRHRETLMIQRAWRGERPQEGRYREFRQCDIDVLNIDHLPLQFDAEMPAIIYDILRGVNSCSKS
jgi:histidyl-tRNA synthetase